MKIKDIYWYKGLWKTLRNKKDNIVLTIKIECSLSDIEGLNQISLDMINSVIQESI